MAVSTVTSKGQITIPKAIRDRFGLSEGTVLEFVVEEDGKIVLRPKNDGGSDRVFGMLREFAPERPVSVEEMKRVVRERATKKAKAKKR